MSAIPLMGYAARRNPLSPEDAKPNGAVIQARLDRFVAGFETRAALDAYLARLDPQPSAEYLAYLESRLPLRLQKGGTV